MPLRKAVLNLLLPLQQPIHGRVQLARGALLPGTVLVLGIHGLAKFSQAQHLAQRVVLSALCQRLRQRELAGGIEDSPSDQRQCPLPHRMAFAVEQRIEAKFAHYPDHCEDVPVRQGGLGNGLGADRSPFQNRL